MATTKSPAHMAAAKSATHMAAAAKPAAVSTPAAVSAATPTTTRKRVGGQSPGESGSHSQNDHGLA
jgi:hypothetical protein